MEAQNCPNPKCKCKPVNISTIIHEGKRTYYYACPNALCDFYKGDDKTEEFGCELSMWNRIRIAPDGEYIERHAQKVSHFHLNPLPKDRVYFKPWMNPHYPKDSDDTADKTN